MEKLTDGIKTLLLAGVGAVALTADMSQELLKELVSRGELTVEQGKALNQELKHTFDESRAKADAEKTDTLDFIKNLSKDELDKLKELIKEREQEDENA